VIPLGIFELLHVLTTLLALVGVVFTWKLAACVAGPRAGFLAAWPWAQLEPLQRPLRAAAIPANYAWRSRVLFDGARIGAYDLPGSYLSTGFGITLPDQYVVSVSCMPIALLGVLRRHERAWASC
jgi:hypothetical protein